MGIARLGGRLCGGASLLMMGGLGLVLGFGVRAGGFDSGPEFLLHIYSVKV